MNDEQLARARELARKAAALEGGERERYLRRLGEDDPLVVAEVNRRLRFTDAIPEDLLERHPLPAFLAPREAPSETREAEEVITPLAGERYMLEECLGTGGMATVYKARDRWLDRPVALKLLRRTDAATVRRFFREAQAQARVDHDNVLKVYETGERAGQPFIAVHYVCGSTLMEVREETSVEEKVRLLAAVAEGLHAAHRQGLVHRDVKPSNILVERRPENRLKPYVTDFGIAAAVDSQGSTAEGLILGSLQYLAPERVTDHTRELDRRSDVFSLGVTMYEFLSGRLPFPTKVSPQALNQLLHGQPRPLNEVASSLPADLVAIVMKCLERQPAQRYSSARAVAEDLRRYLDGEPVTARPGTLAFRIGKRVRRHKAVVSIMAALGVVLVAFSLRISMAARRIGRELARADQEAATANQVAELLAGVFPANPGTPCELAVRDLLGEAAGARRIRSELRDQPRVRIRLLRLLADAYWRRGLVEGAVPLVEQAVEIGRTQLPPGDQDFAEVVRTLAGLYHDLGDHQRAEDLLRRHRAAPPGSPDGDRGHGRSRP